MREHPRNVVATGGETAWHLLNALGLRELLVEGEILLGIAQTLANVEGKVMRVLTKSDGFGSEDTLVRLCGAMNKGNRVDGQQGGRGGIG